MSAGGKWPPYHYMTDSGLTGIDIVLTEQILAAANLALETKILPAPRAHEYLRNGTLDLLSGASYTEERNVYAQFSGVPYRQEQIVIFVRKGTAANWPMNRLIDISKFRGLRLAAGRGGWYGAQYDEVLKDPVAGKKVNLVGDIEARLKMLAASRVDMVIDDRNALVWEAHGLDLSDAFEVHPLVLSSVPIYLMFSRVSVEPETIGKIDKAIKGLQQSGKLDQVLQEFLKNLPTQNK